MGLLDDAIREHLELKRRHGADPGEIARLEQEALGPARREPIQAAPPQPAEPEQDDWHAHEGSAAYDDEPLYEDVLDEPPPPAAAPYPAPPAAGQEPAAPRDQPTQQFSLSELEDAGGEAPPAPEPRPAAPAERPAPPDPEDTAELVPADEEPGEDDVLEETPEFLQETPEHDRLWFEQKPPRDFDF
jgi:hypothetical protein